MPLREDATTQRLDREAQFAYAMGVVTATVRIPELREEVIGFMQRDAGKLITYAAMARALVELFDEAELRTLTGGPSS